MDINAELDKLNAHVESAIECYKYLGWSPVKGVPSNPFMMLEKAVYERVMGMARTVCADFFDKIVDDNLKE